MKFINKMHKKEKGFTLVEIIVVLVILAILAAFTIPTMLGFVGDANSKALLAEGREVYIAAQATATELSATNVTFTAGNLGGDEVNITDPISDASKQMKKYLGTDLKTGRTWTVVLDTTGKIVQSVTYSDGTHSIIVTPGSGSKVIS